MENIKSATLVETKRENKYFFDRKAKRFQLCHPAFYHILKLSEILDLRSWLNHPKNNSEYVEIENYGLLSKKEIEYYIQKFLLLKENGYFVEIDQEKKLSAVIEPDTIRRSLANLRHLVLEVTDQCNLQCKYCGYGEFYCDFRWRDKINMDARDAKTLLDYLLNGWNSPFNTSHERNICVSFYGGEPLLNFSFIAEMVDYIKLLKPLHNRFTFSMTTNGTLLHKYLDFLYTNDFDLLVSLDGDERNNAYRMFKSGKPAYNTILENVYALQKKYPDYYRKRVNFVAVLHNKNSVSDVYNFFKKQFDKNPHIIGLNTANIKESKKKEFWKMYANINQSLHESEDYSLIEKDMLFKLPTTNDMTRFLYYCNDFCFENYNHLIYDTDAGPRVPTGTCLPFSQRMFLTVNGKILPCERINHHYELGCVTPDSVELDYEKVAEKYNSYYNKLRKQCNACYNAEICRQCMFNISSIEDQNPVCNGLMCETDYKKFLSSVLSYFEETPGAFSRMLTGSDSEENSPTLNRPIDQKDLRKQYWFSIETYVHISIKRDSLLLYNSLNGEAIQYSGEQYKKIFNLVKQLQFPGELHVILLDKEDLQDPVISEFVWKVRNHFMGDVICASYSSGKPIQMMPIVTIEKSVEALEKDEHRSVGDNVMQYLTEVSLYINNDCTRGCGICHSAYKQFPCCTIIENGNNELDLLTLKHIFEELKGSPLMKIKILGGNIFTYSRFKELVGIVNHLESLKIYYVHYMNLIEKGDSIKYLNPRSSLLKILVPFPIDEEQFKPVPDILEISKVPSRFIFVVWNEEQFEKAESIISLYQLEDYQFQPYFNGGNLSFFKEGVFLNEEDIFESKMKIKDIYINSTVNRFNFGRLTICNNGDIYANVNDSRLGILGKNSIHEVLYKEMYYGKSWRRIRKNVEPCKRCTFEALCPPLADYTHVIGKNDLCYKHL